MNDELPANMNRYLESLIQTTETLINVLKSETEFVRARSKDQIRHIHNEKVRLSYLYEEHMKALAEKPEIMRNATPEQKSKLEELAYAFEDAAKENLKLLKAAHESGKRVLNAIRKAVENSNKETVNTYSGSGTTARRTGTGSTSLSLDEKL